MAKGYIYNEGTDSLDELKVGGGIADTTNLELAIQRAQQTADGASTAAGQAQSTANAANTAAGQAQSTANAANTAAGQAQSTANEALNKANAAGTVKSVNGNTPDTSGNVTLNIPAAVTLNNTVTSTSTTQAATANAVKTAYDAATAAQSTANSALTKANAAGTVKSVNGNTPDANGNVTVSTGSSITLNNTVTSTSTTQAATANAVKTAYDAATAAQSTANSALTKANAAGTVKSVNNVSPNSSGNVTLSIPSLNNTVTSTSTTQAATANAVKMAYDRATTALNKANAAAVVETSSAGNWFTINGKNRVMYGHAEIPANNKYTTFTLPVSFVNAQSFAPLAITNDGVDGYMTSTSTVSKSSIRLSSVTEANVTPNWLRGVWIVCIGSAS